MERISRCVKIRNTQYVIDIGDKMRLDRSIPAFRTGLPGLTDFGLFYHPSAHPAHPCSDYLTPLPNISMSLSLLMTHYALLIDFGELVQRLGKGRCERAGR